MPINKEMMFFGQDVLDVIQVLNYKQLIKFVENLILIVQQIQVSLV